MERTQVTDCLIGVDQDISDWLIKFRFWGEAGPATWSGITPRFGIMGFSASDTILGLGSSL